MRKQIITFAKWAQKYADEDNRRGDLARRIRDRLFPELGTKNEITAFMKENKYTQEQIALFKELWQEYCQEHKQDIRRIWELRGIIRKTGIGAADLQYIKGAANND